MAELWPLTSVFPIAPASLLRLLKIDAGFSLQSRKPVWLLGQHLAFTSATGGAVWLWVRYELVRKLEAGSGPIGVWGIGNDIEVFLVLFHEMQAILHGWDQLCIGIARGHGQELLENLDLFCQSSTGPWCHHFPQDELILACNAKVSPRTGWLWAVIFWYQNLFCFLPPDAGGAVWLLCCSSGPACGAWLGYLPHCSEPPLMDGWLTRLGGVRGCSEPRPNCQVCLLPHASQHFIRKYLNIRESWKIMPVQ